MVNNCVLNTCVIEFGDEIKHIRQSNSCVITTYNVNPYTLFVHRTVKILFVKQLRFCDIHSMSRGETQGGYGGGGDSPLQNLISQGKRIFTG